VNYKPLLKLHTIFVCLIIWILCSSSFIVTAGPTPPDIVYDHEILYDSSASIPFGMTFDLDISILNDKSPGLLHVQFFQYNTGENGTTIEMDPSLYDIIEVNSVSIELLGLMKQTNYGYSYPGNYDYGYFFGLRKIQSNSIISFSSTKQSDLTFYLYVEVHSRNEKVPYNKNKKFETVNDQVGSFTTAQRWGPGAKFIMWVETRYSEPIEMVVHRYGSENDTNYFELSYILEPNITNQVEINIPSSTDNYPTGNVDWYYGLTFSLSTSATIHYFVYRVDKGIQNPNYHPIPLPFWSIIFALAISVTVVRYNRKFK
jgi:hypothetical protein